MDYRPLAEAIGTYSVFRMSIGKDWTDYGDRIAYIHPVNTSYFWLSSPIDGNNNWAGSGLIASPPIGEWCSIEVVHKVEKGEYVYNVTVDGVVKISAKNSDPAEFSNVLVYASDPWKPSQPSHIRALTIQTIMVSNPRY